MSTTTTGNDDSDGHHHQVLKIYLALGATAASLLLGWKLHRWTTTRTASNAPSSSSSWKDWLTPRHKLVLVVSGDNAPSILSAGQLAAHCASATILAFKTASRETPLSTLLWRLTGQTKVVVRSSVFEFTRLAEEASKRRLASSLIKVREAEDDPRSKTRNNSSSSSSISRAAVLAIGPGPVRLVDQVTGHLKLVR